MKRKYFSFRRAVTFLVIAALLVTFVIGTQEPSSRSLSGVAQIADGDSVRINNQRIRLIGIDAPELKQDCKKAGESWACGQAARSAFKEKVGNNSINCVGEKLDQYRRLLAICYLGREDLNAWLVREGWAVSYNDYLIDEVLARRDRRGIWASDFQPPHQWRALHGSAESSALSWLSQFWPF